MQTYEYDAYERKLPTGHATVMQSTLDTVPRFLVVMPEGQDLQLVEPDRYWYLLSAHSSQAVAPVRGANLPVGQLVQDRPVPLTSNLPAGHAMETQ